MKISTRKTKTVFANKVHLILIYMSLNENAFYKVDLMILYVKAKCGWCKVRQLTAKVFAAAWLNLEQSSGD